MKKCFRCGAEKEDTDFPSWRGGENVCRECHNTRRKENRHAGGQMSKVARMEYMRAYRERNKDDLLNKARERRKNNPMAAMWKHLSGRGSKLLMTRSEFMTLLIPHTCPILGIPITYDLTRDNIPSVDRIDPNRPYEIGNVSIISYRANMIKSIGSADEHRLIAEWMARNGNPPAKEIGCSPIGVGPVYLKFGRGRERL